LEDTATLTWRKDDQPEIVASRGWPAKGEAIMEPLKKNKKKGKEKAPKEGCFSLPGALRRDTEKKSKVKKNR